MAGGWRRRSLWRSFHRCSTRSPRAGRARRAPVRTVPRRHPRPAHAAPVGPVPRGRHRRHPHHRLRRTPDRLPWSTRRLPRRRGRVRRRLSATRTTGSDPLRRARLPRPRHHQLQSRRPRRLLRRSGRASPRSHHSPLRRQPWLPLDRSRPCGGSVSREHRHGTRPAQDHARRWCRATTGLDSDSQGGSFEGRDTPRRRPVEATRSLQLGPGRLTRSSTSKTTCATRSRGSLRSPFLKNKDSVRGFVFDVATGELHEVS